MPTPPTTFRRDLAAGYAASFTKVASWAAVSAVVYRQLGAEAFAVLVLVRGTLGVLNHVTLGVAPALLRAVLRADAESAATASAVRPGRVLDYETQPPSIDPAVVAIVSAMQLALATLSLGVIIAVAFAAVAGHIFVATGEQAPEFGLFAALFGIGLALRVASDIPAAVLHARKLFALDAALLLLADLAWALWLLIDPPGNLGGVGATYVTTSIMLVIGRAVAFRVISTWPLRRGRHFCWRTVGGLLAFGGWVTLANVADFLYAPIDYIILNRMVGPLAVAAYGPAVQIDAALLLLVTGLATVLLPYAARASAFNDVAALRKQYVVGTFASLGLLAVFAVFTWFIAPWLLTAWLGEVPSGTLAVLPLVLVHTVVGGSSAVGRSVLIGMGRVKALAVSVLVAGVANVGLSVLLAGPMGLRGVVLATVVVVTARCGLWMPWYVLRQLREAGAGAAGKASAG